METLFELPKTSPPSVNGSLPIKCHSRAFDARSSKNLQNPMLAFGIGEPGTRCKDCRHLQRFHQVATWFKCSLRTYGKGITGGKATDHKANWQACSKFQSIDPSCPTCGAKKLEDCCRKNKS